MHETTATHENRIATNYDSSGFYSIHRDGDNLITLLDGGTDRGGEQFAETLTRAPEFDSWEGWADCMFSETFGVTEDLGEHGAALINGEAFLRDWDDDAYLLVSTAPDLADAITLVIAEQRENVADLDDDTDAEVVAHVRNVLCLPGQPALGGMEVEDDGTPLAEAFLVVLKATDAQLVEFFGAKLLGLDSKEV